MHFCWILWTLVLVAWTDALKQGEPGVCVQEMRIPKTRVKSYQVTVPCRGGRGKCSQQKTITERYEQKEFIEICCDMYLFEEKNGTERCIPECENDCEGGTCVAPNVCICEPPLVLRNASYPHKCVLPVCDNPCVNGVCTANNQCTCNDGFILKEDNFTCAAHCTNCTNGDCARPDVCKCREGYIMENGHCIPHCKNGCSNGFCSAPGICTCVSGYEIKNENCEPVCEAPCLNGECVAPNVCKCLEGYEAKDRLIGTCTPKCESCAHGVCSAPNKCECHDGYELVDKDCKPICDKGCVHAHCSNPNECSCDNGYIVLNSSVCHKPCGACIDGSCDLEGQCTCEKDMELINGTCVLETPLEPSGITAPTTGLASLQLTWWVGGAVALLLTVLVLVVISRIWHTRKEFNQKSPDEGPYGSVAYTVPNTLMRDDLHEADEEPSDVLLNKETSVV